MVEEAIISTALDKLKEGAFVEGVWKPGKIQEIDGTLELRIGGITMTFNIEVKNELRSHQLPQLVKLSGQYTPFMVVALRIMPKIKDQLRQHHIAYLEGNGNIFVNLGQSLVWIDVHKPVPPETRKASRAFTKTGLKVVFAFLLDQELLSKPYRELATQTGTSIGNLTHIINGLKQEGFILTKDKNSLILHEPERLLSRWVGAYEDSLKPSLQVGTFRFLKEPDFSRWRDLPLLPGQTYWGGEAAGDLLTDHLRPELLTLYTAETRNDLMKRYRLVPDPKGNVQVYKKFWRGETSKPGTFPNTKAVPPLLAYADLMNQTDKRCRETAQLLYERYLRPNL